MKGKVCGTPLTPIGYFSSGAGGARKVHPLFAHSAGTRRIKGISAYPSQPKVSVPHVHTAQHRVRLVSPSVKKQTTSSISQQRTEANLNAKVFHGLERKYGPSKTGEIIHQAQSAYAYHHPETGNTAETYELFEGGNIDEAIESLGLSRWTIGRPKTFHPLLLPAAILGGLGAGVVASNPRTSEAIRDFQQRTDRIFQKAGSLQQ